MSRASSPAQIDLNDSLSSTFGKCEVEQAAVELLKFLTYRGRGWASFPLDEYFQYRHSLRATDADIVKYPLFGLLGAWYDDGGAGQVWPDQKWLLHLGEFIEIEPAFIERVSRHMRVAKRRPSV